MELPKIKNDDLPEELKSILGDDDAVFDSIVNPMDILTLNFNPEVFNNERIEIAEKYIECRKKLQQSHETKRHNKISKENTETSEETS